MNRFLQTAHMVLYFPWVPAGASAATAPTQSSALGLSM